MRIFGILFIFSVVIYANKLSIGFASINPARNISSIIREINDGIVKERHLDIKVKFLNFKSKHIKNNNDKEDISEVLDEFSVSLYDALHRSGPSLSTKEQQEARFSDVQYKEVALTPKNIKKVWVFHENRKKYGIKFLSSLAKKQKLDIIIFQKIAKRKWTSFGANLNGDGSIKPTIAVFNNFSKAHTFSYPRILAKYFINEEYEKISSIIEEKSIDALKKAFSVGVADSFLDNKPIKKETKKTSTKKTKKIQVNDLSDVGGTGGF